MQLQKHVKEIRMYPTFEDGKKFYVAEGEWFMPENNNATGPWIDGGVSLLRMVAGVDLNHSATLRTGKLLVS